MTQKRIKYRDGYMPGGYCEKKKKKKKEKQSEKQQINNPFLNVPVLLKKSREDVKDQEVHAPKIQAASVNNNMSEKDNNDKHVIKRMKKENIFKTFESFKSTVNKIDPFL